MVLFEFPLHFGWCAFDHIAFLDIAEGIFLINAFLHSSFDLIKLLFSVTRKRYSERSIGSNRVDADPPFKSEITASGTAF